ncbi:general stress protein 13 [Enterococcus haemoperoxidus ATCC BAA-382]|uniref:General stress protein 13 n=1 Tax=Enterococcus haemoperoxidus ATCC BAA-382 TaxID=1158608 RepID=R2SY65_9ENTE|nr:CvfD/Ygs/GSP13 family RNA-binding post-transcriptional regulator [Enterococcus haemoperoxidus]EOI00203.1 general stress protein 13 [Enterococcus haemoperoxidus ATCC BAA-382]EOT59559.1 general stress protein 13 [Enterococcus haemoperoxidus ATCC BAA-382]OJG52397.1 general stress protein 13 [Enterococcus haemoperoxidus]
MEYKIGMILNGTITGLQPYGAFVSLSDTVQGLIHVSEVQAGYTKNIHSLLVIGQKVEVQVIDIDEYSKKISLSLRTLEPQIQQPNHRRKKYFTNKNKKIGFETLEKELPIWTDEAMDKLLEK